MSAQIKNNIVAAASVIALMAIAPSVSAQQPTPPADGTPQVDFDTAPAQPDATEQATPPADSQLPPVEVIQTEQPPQPPPQQQQVQPVQQAQPAPQPPPVQQAAPAPAGPDTFDGVPDFAAGLPADTPATLAQQRASGDLVPVSPIGALVPIGSIPGSVTTVGADTIAGNGRVDPQDALLKQVPGIALIDAGGNNVRQQLDYRGFGAGPITGFAQGVAVYQNGVRINEVFGDVVNWDLLPSNAISDITVLSGNPVYGLNAIGGGVAINTKDGFGYQGVELTATGGSYGYREFGVQIGQQVGPWAFYFAGEKIDEDGWRDFSPVDVQRMYADIGAKGSLVEVHANLTWANSDVGIVAATPEELLAVDRDRTFTSPQTTELELLMPTVNAKVKATNTLTLSGLAYYRRFKSSVIDGNVLEGESCEEVAEETLEDQLGMEPTPGQIATLLADSGVTDEQICSEELEDGELEALESQNGPLEEDDFEEPFGVIDRINQKAESFGGTVQATEEMDLLGFANTFIVGATYDRGNVLYTTQSEFGEIGPRFVVTGAGEFLNEPDDFKGRRVDVDTEYIGVYFLNALDVTDEFTLTVGGRYNYASVDLVDLTGEFEGITSSHTFERFNPSVGGTYELIPGLTLFAGYSEANRAPTPAELACANPENPCPIESFLTDDPPLEQVISRTTEVGLRGKMTSPDGRERFTYGVNYFRTSTEDDLFFVSATQAGRGFFFNAGDTLRQGIEAKLTYTNDTWALYAGYSYVSATFEDTIEFQSPANPAATQCLFEGAEDGVNCVTATPGDRLPNTPEHRFKAGVEYMATSNWMVGADLIVTSDQVFLGDESNLLSTLDGYTRVDVKTSYQVTENVQIFGYVNNIFDEEYGLFGTLFEFDEAPTEPVGVDGFEFTNPRSVVPGQPVAAYGGVKVNF
ncbi:MAG: TonB-dependent receptor [Pseudomonadota bacterium]